MSQKPLWFLPYTVNQIVFNCTNKVHSYFIENDYIVFKNPSTLGFWNNSKRHCVKSNVKVYTSNLVTYTLTGIPTSGYIIYAHGNGWDLGTLHRPFKPHPADHSQQVSTQTSLPSMIADITNCCVVCFEFAGYGTEDSSKVDAKQTINNLLQLLYIFENRGKPVYLMGFSIGAAIIVESLKSKIYVDGIILQSAVTKLSHIKGRNWIENYVLQSMKGLDIFDMEKTLSESKIPVAFIHGSRDPLCPIQCALQVFRKYKYSVVFETVAGADHNTVPISIMFGKKLKQIISKLHS
jgi:predicted esterase